MRTNQSTNEKGGLSKPPFTAAATQRLSSVKVVCDRATRTRRIIR